MTDNYAEGEGGGVAGRRADDAARPRRSAATSPRSPPTSGSAGALTAVRLDHRPGQDRRASPATPGPPAGAAGSTTRASRGPQLRHRRRAASSTHADRRPRHRPGAAAARGRPEGLRADARSTRSPVRAPDPERRSACPTLPDAAAGRTAARAATSTGARSSPATPSAPLRDSGRPCDIGAVESPAAARPSRAPPPGAAPGHRPAPAATAPRPLDRRPHAAVRRARRPRAVALAALAQRVDALRPARRGASTSCCGCTARSPSTRSATSRHRWGFRYDERDGTGLDTRPALARHRGRGRARPALPRPLAARSAASAPRRTRDGHRAVPPRRAAGLRRSSRATRRPRRAPRPSASTPGSPACPGCRSPRPATAARTSATCAPDGASLRRGDRHRHERVGRPRLPAAGLRRPATGRSAAASATPSRARASTGARPARRLRAARTAAPARDPRRQPRGGRRGPRRAGRRHHALRRVPVHGRRRASRARLRLRDRQRRRADALGALLRPARPRPAASST